MAWLQHQLNSGEGLEPILGACEKSSDYTVRQRPETDSGVRFRLTHENNLRGSSITTFIPSEGRVPTDLGTSD